MGSQESADLVRPVFASSAKRRHRNEGKGTLEVVVDRNVHGNNSVGLVVVFGFVHGVR